MSNREFAKSLIDQIPDSKIYYIIAYLQGAAIPMEIPKIGRASCRERVCMFV